MVRRSAIRHESAARRCARTDRLTGVSYAELVRIVRKIAQQAGELTLTMTVERAVVYTEFRMSSAPSTSELLALGASVVLRDGSRVRLRPGHRSDRELLLRGFERLSPESRYRRFLAAMPELSEEVVRYLTEVDHHDHEAIAALDEQTGEGVGVARYVRDPQRPDVAEFAVTVIDDWQEKGLGTLLLEVLGARARAAGISSFTALMLASNQEMMDVLDALAECGSSIANWARSRSRCRFQTSGCRPH